MCTLTLYRVDNPLEYGVVVTGEDGRIREFQEKPSWSEVVTDTINTGIYVLEPSIFEYYERNQVFDFSKELFPLLLREDRPLFGFVAEGYWTDVGSLEEYVRATRDVLAGEVSVDWGNATEEGGVRRERGVEISLDAELHPPIYAGSDVKIEGAAIVLGPSVIGDNTIVMDRAHVDRSIIWKNSYIGADSEIRGSLLGEETNIKARAVVFENAVVADQTVVGRGAIIQPNVKIWPHKEIEPGAVVATSIIWGAGVRRALFGQRGVSGLINVDFTPGSLAKLGSAYASTLPLGADVTLNRDLAVPSRMLKRALASGIPSAGANVVDLSAVPIPVARFYTAMSGAAGGIHVRISSYDRAVCHVAFFDGSGMDVDKASQRKIESAYFREDFRRSHIDDIGTTTYAPDVLERYRKAFLARVDREAIAAAGYHLVVDYSFGTASEVLAGILRFLGCQVIDINAEIGLPRTVRSAPEYATALDQLSRMVPALQFSLGVMLDVNGERLQIVDAAGRQIPQLTVLVAMATLAFHEAKGAAVAVPVDAPSVFETLAASNGGRVVRTRLDAQAIMSAATQKGVRLSGDGQGRSVFPQLHPAYDAMFSLAKLLELLAKQHTSLGEVVDSLPQWHLTEGTVACPWDRRGSVMRLLGERYRNRRVRAADGIKIQLSRDWVLIVPHPDEPQFRLVAEARSAAAAEALVGKYGGIVTALQR